MNSARESIDKIRFGPMIKTSLAVFGKHAGQNSVTRENCVSIFAGSACVASVDFGCDLL